MLPTMSGEDVDKFMKELQRQEEAKRKAISDQVRGNILYGGVLDVCGFAVRGDFLCGFSFFAKFLYGFNRNFERFFWFLGLL